MAESATAKSVIVGAMSFDLEGVAVDHVALRGRSPLRSIFATVRDPNWRTCSPVQCTSATADLADGKRIVVEADYRPAAPVIARLTITARNDASIDVHLSARVLERFRTNRLGLCVLHPASLAGQPVRIDHTHGTTSVGVFPTLIAPHQPFKSVRSVCYEQGGVEARLDFAGDVFETEDQRNWIDASYKTYCTPLDRPMPIELAPGAVIEQSVRVKLRLIESRPSVGVMVNRPLTPRASDALSRLRLGHVRVDLPMNDPAWRDRLASAQAIARKLGASLMVAGFGVEPQNARSLVEALAEADAEWLLALGSDRRVPSIEAARIVRDAGWQGALAVGSDSNFTELNRAGPIDPTLIDGVFFAANPQVHAFDDTSILETPQGLEACVTSARWLAPGLRVLVSPLTLRPRFNAVATSHDVSEGPDARQQGDLAARWIDAAIRACAHAGADAVTAFEACGPDGILLDDGTPTPAARILGGT